MPIYDKPTKVLMHEFAKERLSPGQIFDKAEAIDWFEKHYPKIRPTTVQMHIEGMAVNSSARRHHPSIRPGSGHDLFFKVGPGKFRLWNKETDAAPQYRDQLLQSAGSLVSDEPEEVEEAGVEAASGEFAFERDLRNYLARNLNLIEPGLKVFDEEEISGVEIPVGGRFIDILAVDATGSFVVIELKVSRGYDRTIGQLMRYMAWVKRNLAAGKAVHGLIVAREITDDLKLAASLIPDVRLVEYELSFKLKAVTE